MSTGTISLRNAFSSPALALILALSFAVPHALCYGQAQEQSAAPIKVADLHGPSPDGAVSGGTTTLTPTATAATPDPEISPAVAKQLAAMQAEIEELRAELKGRAAVEATTPVSAGPAVNASVIAPQPPTPAPAVVAASRQQIRQPRPPTQNRQLPLPMPTGPG